MFSEETNLNIALAGSLGLDGEMMNLLKKGFSDKTESDKSNESHRELITSLNNAFEKGRSIVEMSDQLQKLHKPILVDWNNVLVTNGNELEVNPDALKALAELRAVGTVVILTTAENWSSIKNFLIQQDLFSKETDDLVLITAENFEKIFDEWSQNPDTVFNLMEQYFNLALDQNLLEPHMTTQPYQQLFRSSVAGKRVAFAFGKPYLVPLVDDTPLATERNPGIKGITVVPFASEDEGPRRIDPSSIPLLEAVKSIKEYYSTISD